MENFQKKNKIESKMIKDKTQNVKINFLSFHHKNIKIKFIELLSTLRL